MSTLPIPQSMKSLSTTSAFHIEDRAKNFMMVHGVPQLDLAITKNGDAYLRRFCSHFTHCCDHHVADTYMLSSITKTMTAYLVVAKAKSLGITLSDPIIDHLPVLAKCSNIGPSVRIIDLLGHTAGINPVRFSWASFDSSTEGVGVLEAFERGEYCFSVNADRQGFWSYTSVAYDILGALIESKSGRPFSDFLTDNILVPLGMDECSSDVQKIPPGKLCQPTVFDHGEVLKLQGAPNAVRHHPSAVLYATAHALSKWGAFIATRGATHPEMKVSSEIFDVMWASRTTTGLSHCPTYGLGWFIANWASYMVVGHGGRECGFNTLLITYPNANLSITILMNTHSANVISLAAEISRALGRSGLLDDCDAP